MATRAPLDISPSEIRELYSYDPETGLLLHLKKRRGATVGKSAARRKPNGYYFVKIRGRYIYVQDVIWAHMTGEWPLSIVDHKDTDQGNNKWDNFRLATTSQNCMNRKPKRNSKSGLKGVTWLKNKEKWRSNIMVDRKSIYLGEFKTPEKAHLAYCEAAKKHFGEFARAT